MEVFKKPDNWYSHWCKYWYSGFTHKEARDDRMVFFTEYLPKGEITFNYLIRAETPGLFVNLPARAELMYEPETMGNSNSSMVRIMIGDFE